MNTAAEMITAWWLIIVFVALDAGILIGWCLRVALTRAQVETYQVLAWGVAEAGWPSLHDNEQDAIEASIEAGGNAYVVPLTGSIARWDGNPKLRVLP